MVFQRQKRAQLLRAKQSSKPKQKSHLRNAALLISSFSPALTVLATILSAGVLDAGHGGFVCLHLLVALLLVVVDVLAAATVAAEGGRPARHRRGEVRRLRVPGHDHQYLLLPYRRRQARRRLRSAAGAGVGAVLASPPGGAALQVPGELPVGARQDEKRQGYEAQHRGQPAEKVRHRRVPRGVRRGAAGHRRCDCGGLRRRRRRVERGSWPHCFCCSCTYYVRFSGPRCFLAFTGSFGSFCPALFCSNALVMVCEAAAQRVEGYL
uniref:Uncharacterized protein n=1 Tax=Zea mays TaxID=4577 RepID=B6UFL8_MAIZE|nr:hypothetical protein [Zea mays]